MAPPRCRIVLELAALIAVEAMRLIHLSDIHFTAGTTWDPDLDQRDELLRDVVRLVEQGGKVDAILVGGDIAFSGADEQYEVAAGWLEELRAASGCPEGAIWVVPGNHDIDRGVHLENRARTTMINELRQSHLAIVDARLGGWLNGGDGLLNCLAAYNRFAERVAVPPTTATSPHWTDLTLDLEGLDVCLTGINSVLTSDCADWPTPKLILGQQQCSLPRREDLVHIVFAHHPPAWIYDWPNVEPYLRRAHLVLFGHEHQFRVEQPQPGLTLTVYAGAVGPARLGADAAPPLPDHADDSAPSDYSACWGLIELHRDGGEEIVVSIDPRIWSADETRFVRHPDGVETRRVRLDLAPIGAATTASAESEAAAAIAEANAGSNSSPLIPDSTEVQQGVPLPSPDERARLRALAVAFMRQTPTHRLHIADQLGVAEGLAELNLQTSAEALEILRRVRAANKINELRGLIDA